MTKHPNWVTQLGDPMHSTHGVILCELSGAHLRVNCFRVVHGLAHRFVCHNVV